MSKSNNENRRHRAVTVKVGKLEAEIDEFLVPLIAAIWSLQIETIMSCQEVEPGIAWVEFASIPDLIKFLDMVAHYEPGADTLYNRINYQLTGDISAPVWRYQLNLMDLNEIDDYQGPTDLDVTVGVYFPLSDLPAILRHLTEAV